MGWEETEAKLEGRSAERREALGRRDRRRRLLPWLLCPLLLPAAGAAGLVAIAQDDLVGSGELAAAAGCVVVPSLVSWWVGRAHGRVDAALWALVTASLILTAAVSITLLVG